MKCYTFSRKNSPFLYPGILVDWVSNPEIMGGSMRFGEMNEVLGLGEVYEIPVLRNLFSLDRNCSGSGRRIFDMSPVNVVFEPGTIPKLALSAPSKITNQDDQRILLHINEINYFSKNWTKKRDERWIDGNWSTISGDPQTLIRGYGVRGKSESDGTRWFEGLVIMKPGDIIKVNMLNKLEKAHFWIIYFDEDGPNCLPESDYNRVMDFRSLKDSFVITEWI